MESDNTSSAPRLLDFYCRDCDTVFEAAPDGTGYEQTPCPLCGEMCLTVQFEQEEMRRNKAESWFASVVGNLLFGVHLPDGRRSRGQVRAARYATVARYATREDAEADARVLAEHGLRPRIVGEETGSANAEGPARVPPIELQVSEQVAFTTGQMLHALDPPEQEDQTERDVSKEDVVFPCEECGAMLQFPGDRRGKVEVCRHCGAYVDVPT